MVEAACHYFGSELGLTDYMIEEQIPKITLQFHFPKEVGCTKDFSNDYHHSWLGTGLADTLTWHLDRYVIGWLLYLLSEE